MINRFSFIVAPVASTAIGASAASAASAGIFRRLAIRSALAACFRKNFVSFTIASPNARKAPPARERDGENLC
jgi:hypothetical protein